MENTIRRIGRFLEVTDGDGRRYLLPADARNLLVCDTDCLRNESEIHYGSRRIQVFQPYDKVVEALLERAFS
ncbi:hypothetical protein [Microvirga yunnanensis]|uniref:hypothetical protein n=1 Tax=Microvirga yunnanensis TaxID=2953740 RepID=UPI0021C9CC1D|nr:hypothetical protein [Microvirga sp. HBU65207]